MAKKTSKVSGGQSEAEKLQEKKDAFVRVVTPRMEKAIKSIRNVGLCASSNYISTDEQKRAIILALETEIEQVKAAYEGKAKAGSGFVLPQ